MVLIIHTLLATINKCAPTSVDIWKEEQCRGVFRTN